MKWKLSFTLILLFALKVICKKMTIRFLQVNVTGNPVYIRHCSTVINPDKESLDIDLIVNRELDQKMRGLISFSGNFLSQKNATPDFQFDLPICDILNNGMKAKSQVITNSFKNIFKQGNLPAKCPIQPGNYTFPSLRPRKEHMPTFTLGGVIRLLVRLYSNQDMPEVHSRNDFVDKAGKVTILKTFLSFTLI